MAVTFNVGDIITGKPEASDPYSITTSEATMKVLKVYGDGDIRVEVINHRHAGWIGGKHTVNPEHFTLLRPGKYRYQAGDKVRSKEGRSDQTVLLVPGMPEYDKRGYVDPEQGMVVTTYGWVHQQFWELAEAAQLEAADPPPRKKGLGKWRLKIE